jgi:hypothetical protein
MAALLLIALLAGSGEVPGSFNVTVCRWKGAGLGPPEKFRRYEEARRSAVNGVSRPSGEGRGTLLKIVEMDNEGECEREEGREDKKSPGRRVLSGAGDMSAALPYRRFKISAGPSAVCWFRLTNRDEFCPQCALTWRGGSVKVGGCWN